MWPFNSSNDKSTTKAFGLVVGASSHIALVIAETLDAKITAIIEDVTGQPRGNRSFDDVFLAGNPSSLSPAIAEQSRQLWDKMQTDDWSTGEMIAHLKLGAKMTEEQTKKAGERFLKEAICEREKDFENMPRLPGSKIDGLLAWANNNKPR